MNERGKKTKAGQLLSHYLRQISEEKTELIKDDDNEDRIATKAEALARKMWKYALGYSEVEPIYKKGELKGHKEVIHSPDRAMMELVFNRIEGRAPLAIQEGDEKITVTERVSEEGKKRISEAGGLV